VSKLLEHGKGLGGGSVANKTLEEGSEKMTRLTQEESREGKDQDGMRKKMRTKDEVMRWGTCSSCGDRRRL